MLGFNELSKIVWINIKKICNAIIKYGKYFEL